MAALLRQGGLPDHILSCNECRETLQLLARFDVAGRLPLAEPPEAWVERAIELAARPDNKPRMLRKLAQLVFDSWAMPEPVGVRGTATSEHRRLRFEADGIQFDLRAESVKDGWRFVGQLSGIEPGQVRLRAKNKSITPDHLGICQWSEARPPRNLVILAGFSEYRLPSLVWSKKTSKKLPGRS